MEYRAESHPRRTPEGVSYLGWDIVGDGLRVEDVTEDAAFAQALAAVLSREGAESSQVFDIIYDFLSDSRWKKSLLDGGT